jgi:predicted  nucleic acid-binding Zn-ribbon protein
VNEFRSLADLLDLQALDSAIDRLLEERSGLPELERFKAAHEEAAAIGADLARLEGDLITTRRALDKAEGELEILEQKATVTEQRLYAGGMNARETEHMQADVAMLKQQVGDQEEAVLVLIDQRESLDEQVSARSSDHERALAAKGQLEAAIKEAWGRIDAEIARKEARKSDLVPSIDGDLVALYEKSREAHAGVGVGALENETCGACHVGLSPREVAVLKREEFPRCVHCNRLLVI